jgi:hypothetical protein
MAIRMTARYGSLLVCAALLTACGSASHPPSGAQPAAAGGASPSSGVAAFPRPPVLPNGPRLAAIGREAGVYEAPDHNSRRIGYMRLGESMLRSEKTVPGDKCEGGWYAVGAVGYMCVGEDTTLDLGHKILRALGVRPDLTKPMPYRYGFVRAKSALYHQIPVAKDQDHWEFGLRQFRRAYAKGHERWNKVDRAGANHVPLDAYGNAKTWPKDDPPVPPDADPENLFGNLDDGETPWWLRGRRQIPNVSSFKAPDYAFYAGRVERHAGLAVVGSFRADEKAGSRKFAVLLDGRLVGEDKIKPHYASPFHGIPIGDATFQMQLPFAIAKQKAHRYTPAETSRWPRGEDIPFREVIQLTGKTKVYSTNKYYETKDGSWLAYNEISVVAEPNEWPKSFDYKQTKWIDVGILQQTLVLYEGEKPVYATLVSTGADGLGDPKTTKSTILGEFKIDYKHVTATMDADDPENKFELRDVPWVQYFERGYALHAAYWHDDFGRPRSHGCVNLAPIDARKVFFWTDPPLPEGFHGVRSGGPFVPGTWVRTRP